MITCPKCKGSGSMYVEFAGGSLLTFRCDMCCNGTGRVTLLRWIWECHRKELWVAIVILLVVVSIVLKA